MSDERRKSIDSVDEFFGTADNDEDKKSESVEPSAGIAALIKSQPVLHRREARLSSPKSPSPASTPVKKTFDERVSRQSERQLPPVFSKPKPSTVPKAKTMSTKIKRKRERFLPYIRPKMTSFKPQRTEFEDRIHSAQQKKLNELQSRLNILRRQLEIEREENRTLRMIQKREEKALKKYEDQEYDLHRVARDFTKEIRIVKDEIDEEREMKGKLQTQVEEQTDQYQEQRRKLRHFEKLVNDVELDDADELKDKLTRLTKKLNQIEEKIEKKEKQIETLEKNYRSEIQDELHKQRDLKRQLDQKAQDYRNLVLKFEEKNRQVGTMHIYIQRGGRRPSHTSVTLSKSRSLQSLNDPSPRFRQKMLEYDRRRREQEKRAQELNPKPKPKPKPLPAIPKRKTSPPPSPPPPPPPPPPVFKKKVAPEIEKHPMMIKPRTFDHSPLFLEEKGSLHRRTSEKSIEEEKSNVDDDTTYQSTMAPSPTPSPTLPGIQHPDQMSQARIHRRPSSPLVPPQTAPTHLKKPTPLPPLGKTLSKDDSHADKWFDSLELDTTKDDLISKLVSHEPKPKKVEPVSPSTPPSQMISFEPSTISSNGRTIRKPLAPLASIPTLNSYDFDDNVNNLHNGKPIDATRSDPLNSLFTNSSSKKGGRTRDDTFTVNDTKVEPSETFFGPASKAKDLPTLARPKVVKTNPKPSGSQAVVDEIEDLDW